MPRLTKIEEFIIPETNEKVIILGDVETRGYEYAEAHIKKVQPDQVTKVSHEKN